MIQATMNPFTAIVAGSMIGLAIVAPFGGFGVKAIDCRLNPERRQVKCDLVGCTVVPVSCPSARMR